MVINKHKIYFDAARQNYVEFLEETQDIKIITKEAIKKLLYDEYASQDFYDEAKFKTALRDIFLKIETVNLVFDPLRGENYVLNNYTTINTYTPSYAVQKAIQKRSVTSQFYINIDFLTQTPHIKALLENLFTDEIRLTYFINWIARALISKKKNQTAILLRGIQGTGKGVLWEQIIEWAVGRNYCATVSNPDLATNFNGSLENKLIILANEIKGDFKDGNTAYEKLKMWITDSVFRSEQKGIDTRFPENFFNVIIFSNNNVPLQIQGNDRRYTVYETRSKTLRDVARENFNEDMRGFINAIQKERELFLENLFCFEYDDEKAMTIHVTAEKERIYRASMSKIEILADKVKSVDTYFFGNDFCEICEMLGEEKFKILCEEAHIPLLFSDAKLDYKKTIENGVLTKLAMLPIEKNIENSVLVFLYKIFVGEENITKIGTQLNAHFGASVVVKRGDKAIRMREVLQQDELPF